MSFRRVAVLCSVGVASLSLQGCALFSKGDVPMRRYFSPDLPASSVPATGAATSTLELRLGRITAGEYIGARIMYRESAHEVGFYDDRSWTEKPELYLRRELTRVLFEERGLRSVVSGAGPTLDVELINFEEVKAPQHLARVKVAFALSDERVVSLQQTVTVERPIVATSTATEAPAIAQAMGEALGDAISQLAQRVITDLQSSGGRGARPVAAEH